MKNIFKKNQVIIAALAIMITVAGYLNFTQDKVKDNTNGNETVASSDAALEASTQDGAEKTVDETNADVANADKIKATADPAASPTATKGEKTSTDKTDTDDVALSELELSTQETDGTTKVSDTGELVEESNSTDNVGEAVLANTSIGSEFFAAAKLSREQTRAKNKETLMDIIDNKNVTEEQKQDAIDSMISLTTISEKENVTETLLEAKGFQDAVVTMIDDAVEVVVNANTLTEQQMAQIEDVVKRKTGIAPKNIVITPVMVEEEQQE